MDERHEPLTAEAVGARLHTAVFGRSLTVLPQTGSTNDEAKRLALAGAPEGTAVVAVAQTAGRGRRGRAFFSPSGGVYLSVILRPAGVGAEYITSCAAVAAARAIERFSACPVGIKWVNDLWMNGKKAGGILAEGHLPDFVVLGWGINVARPSFDPTLTPIVTSLEAEGCRVSRAALIAALLEEWETAYATAASGDFLSESRRRSVVLGRRVTVSRGDERFCATAEEITDEGHLLVRDEAGETVLLRSGEVSLRVK